MNDDHPKPPRKEDFIHSNTSHSTGCKLLVNSGNQKTRLLFAGKYRDENYAVVKPKVISTKSKEKKQSAHNSKLDVESWLGTDFRRLVLRLGKMWNVLD